MRTAAAFLVLLSLFVGCSGRQAQGDYSWQGHDEVTNQNLNIRQGPMPENRQWTGLYRSPQIGDVELVQTGDAIVGRYSYDRGSCHVVARIEGNATGNLLRFAWRENHRPCGRIAPVVGRGFFLFILDTQGTVVRARILGKWGYGDQEQGGGDWTAFQVVNRQPRLLEEMQSGEADAGEADASL